MIPSEVSNVTTGMEKQVFPPVSASNILHKNLRVDDFVSFIIIITPILNENIFRSIYEMAIFFPNLKNEHQSKDGCVIFSRTY